MPDSAWAWQSSFGSAWAAGSVRPSWAPAAPRGAVQVDPAPGPGGPGHRRSRRTPAMAVARVTEISATSPQSFEDAIRQGLERATKTLRGVTSAWIKDQRVKLADGQIAEYQVNMEGTFVLEG